MTIFKMTGGELYGRKSEELSKEERKIDEADMLYTTNILYSANNKQSCHFWEKLKQKTERPLKEYKK